MSEPIDAGNDQFAGMNGLGQVTVLMPKNVMTRDEALRHAAWLVAIADPDGGDFARVLNAVRNT